MNKQPEPHRYFGPYERFIKRPLDCFLACFALLLLWPVLLVTAVIVKTRIGSPVFFCQKRPGRIDPKTGQERIFRLYKFRSMTNERDENGDLLPDEERLTPLGQALRRSSVDELPELLNIIKGDMAIVGPRPLLVKYLPWYSTEQRRRHDVRPGLTGYAQAHGRNAVNWDEKFAMDVQYADHITFRGDVQIIMDTVKTVIKREGISSETSATMESFSEYCESLGRRPRV